MSKYFILLSLLVLSACRQNVAEGPIVSKDPNLTPNDSIEKMLAAIRKQDLSDKFVAPEYEQALKNPTAVSRIEIQAAGGRLSEIGKLENLQELLLTYLNVKQLPEGIASLKRLQLLDILCLPNLEVLPQSLSTIPYLHHFSITGGSGCDTIKVPANLFQVVGNISGLQTLRIRGINTVYNYPAEIGRLSRLHSLDFSGTRIAYINPNISQNTQLDTLILEDNNLTTLPASIGRLSKLQYLSLRGNRGLRALPAEVAQLTSLEVLALGFGDEELYNANARTIAPYPIPLGIEKFQNLKQLLLYGYSDNDVARFQELLPNVSISNDVPSAEADLSSLTPANEASDSPAN
jgi:Leucine-rich repeat (LRR) protein